MQRRRPASPLHRDIVPDCAVRSQLLDSCLDVVLEQRLNIFVVISLIEGAKKATISVATLSCMCS